MVAMMMCCCKNDEKSLVHRHSQWKRCKRASGTQRMTQEWRIAQMVEDVELHVVPVKRE